MKFPNELMRYILKIKHYNFLKESECPHCEGSDRKECLQGRCDQCKSYVCEDAYVYCHCCDDAVCYDCGYYYNEFINKSICRECYAFFELK